MSAHVIRSAKHESNIVGSFVVVQGGFFKTPIQDAQFLGAKFEVKRLFLVGSA